MKKEAPFFSLLIAPFFVSCTEVTGISEYSIASRPPEERPPVHQLLLPQCKVPEIQGEFWEITPARLALLSQALNYLSIAEIYTPSSEVTDAEGMKQIRVAQASIAAARKIAEENGFALECRIKLAERKIDAATPEL